MTSAEIMAGYCSTWHRYHGMVNVLVKIIVKYVPSHYMMPITVDNRYCLKEPNHYENIGNVDEADGETDLS